MGKNISCRYMQIKDHDEVRDLLARIHLPTDRVNAGNVIMLVAEQGGRIIGCEGIDPIGGSRGAAMPGRQQRKSFQRLRQPAG